MQTFETDDTPTRSKPSRKLFELASRHRAQGYIGTPSAEANRLPEILAQRASRADPKVRLGAGALRLTPGVHDRRNGHRADGATCRLRDNRHDRHAAPAHVRSVDREYVSSGPEVCTARDLWH